jgi:hypothetical protein
LTGYRRFSPSKVETSTIINGYSDYSIQAGSPHQCHAAICRRVVPTDIPMQAAGNLQNLKMSDSPVKKLDFSSMDKENIPVTAEPAVVEPELKKPVVKAVVEPVVEPVKPPVEAPKVAPTIKATEADEPLLQENPQRFVLFPIKYHEVRARLDASTRNVTAKLADSAADMADVQES